MRLATALGIVVVLCASTALIRLASVQQASNAEGWPQPQGSRSRRLAAAAAAVPCVDHPVDQGATCLEQSMWGKCKEPFLEHACHLSCGRCVSAERRRLLQRVLLVSARQAEPCNSTAGDLWAMRAQQNKAAYAQVHGMGVAWSSALLDREYDGAWNKLVLLRALMRAALGGNHTGGEPGGGGGALCSMEGARGGGEGCGCCSARASSRISTSEASSHSETRVATWRGSG